MNKNKYFVIFVLTLILTISFILRISQNNVIDLSTDEGQFSLGMHFTHPFLAISSIYFFQKLLGFNLAILRAFSAILGTLSVLLVYLIGLKIKGDYFGLLFAFLFALIPSHILLSRTIYLDITQLFSWLLVIYFFILIEKKSHYKNLLLFSLFGAVLLSLFIKTQGVLLLVPLYIYGMIKYRRKIIFLEQYWVLFFATIPYFFYLFSHPEILAAIDVYREYSTGMGGLGEKIIIFFNQTLNLDFPYVLLAFLGFLLMIIERKYPFWLLLFLFFAIYIISAFTTSFYYYPYLALGYAFSCAYLITKFRNMLGFYIIILILVFFTLNSFYPFLPFVSAKNIRNYYLHESRFWNNSGKEINSLIQDTEYVIVDGKVGQHVRWYLNKIVLSPKAIYHPSQNLLNKIKYTIVLYPPENILPETVNIIKNSELVYRRENIEIYKNNFTK